MVLKILRGNEIKKELWNGGTMELWTTQIQYSYEPAKWYTKHNIRPCLFVLILYVQVNNFSVMSTSLFLGLTSTKQRIECLAQGHNAVLPVKLETTPPRSQVMHSTTEPLRKYWILIWLQSIVSRSWVLATVWPYAFVPIYPWFKYAEESMLTPITVINIKCVQHKTNFLKMGLIWLML